MLRKFYIPIHFQLPGSNTDIFSIRNNKAIPTILKHYFNNADIEGNVITFRRVIGTPFDSTNQ